MRKRLLFSSEQILTTLRRLGFEEMRRKGSHVVLKRERSTGSGHHVTVVPANCNPMPRGTFDSILRQAGLTYEEFVAAADVKHKK